MKKITKSTIKSIKRNGGATINKYGERVTMTTGYQVSKHDLLIVPEEELTKSMIMNALELLERRCEYVGVWIDGGYAYVDISCRIATKVKAMEMGRELNQLTILRWNDMECLAVN